MNHNAYFGKNLMYATKFTSRVCCIKIFLYLVYKKLWNLKYILFSWLKNSFVKSSPRRLNNEPQTVEKLILNIKIKLIYVNLGPSARSGFAENVGSTQYYFIRWKLISCQRKLVGITLSDTCKIQSIFVSIARSRV